MSEADLEDLREDLEYRGETAPRHPNVAAALALLCPGLGYAYVGELRLGLAVNLGFVLLCEVFIVAQAIQKFFPLGPLGVLALGWLGFALWAAADARRRAARLHDGAYVLKPYNHWLIYGLMALFTLYAPVGISARTVLTYVWRTVEVEHSGMYPNLLVGDVVLVDRAAYVQHRPKTGELVAVSARDEGSPVHLLRNIGEPEDKVRVLGDLLTINEEPVLHDPLKADEIHGPAIEALPNLIPVVEHTPRASHVIAMGQRVVDRTTIPEQALNARDLLLLSDNRSQLPGPHDRAKIRDARAMGLLSTSTLRGKPRYILWSAGPQGVRWGRIGLRVQ